MQNVENNADSKLHLKKSTDSDVFEATKKQPCVILDNLEIDEDDKSLREKNEPDSLESVHKYAKRIKSFLGWEANLEDGEAESHIIGRMLEDAAKVGKIGDGSEVKKSDNFKQESDFESFSELPLEDEEQKNKMDNDVNFNHIFKENGDENREKNVKEISTPKNGNEKNGEKNIKCINDYDIEINTELNDLPRVNKCNSEEVDSIAKKDTKEPIDVTDDTDVFQKNATHANKNADITGNISIEDDNSPEPISEPQFAKSISINTLTPPHQRRKFNESTHYEKTEYGTPSISSLASDALKDVMEDLPTDLINEDTLSSTKSVEDIRSNELENNIETVDAKSEDSICMLEDISSSCNIQKPYLNKLRRLSQDIVKEVIESARNSVHEIFINRNEESDKEIEPVASIIQGNSNVNEEVTIKNDPNFSELYSTLESESVNDENTVFQLKHFSIKDDTPKENVKKFQLGQAETLCRKYSRTQSNLDYTTEDNVCGYGCFKPHWIQKFSRPRIFLVIFSVVGIINSCHYSYIASIMSTLEKRYAFKTKISGAIMSADEIAPLILGILVGHIGGKKHRPRIVALGMFMAAISCFILGLPYIIYGASKHISALGFKNETGTAICEMVVKSETCKAEDLPPTLPVIGIFLLGNFFKGFASVTYYVIGISYMDDGIKKKNSPLYYAIALALRLLGPLLGFLMSSGFLKLYENPLHDPGYGPEDPRWIGAWWIGFFLQGVLLIIFTLPIGLFPRRLPGQKLLTKATAFTTENSLKEIFVGLVAALKRLGRNPVFVLLIINTTMKIFGHFGHAIMLPKYMENQFRLSASEASLFSGATSITCIMVSTLLGGFLVWKFRPGLRALLGGMIASEAIMCIGFLLLMIPRCKTANMLNFGVDDEGLVLNSVCNSNCDCSTTSFTPFCGQDGETMYFSPCYAGCTEELASVMSPKKHKVFGNCSCVNSATYQNNKTIVSEGFCPDENCWSQTLAYLIILFLVIAISNLFTVVHTMILLRSVHPNDKSVALGTFETFLCLFGFIPFPVTYGALVDSACLVWEKSCGETGNCWFYDADRYRYLLHGASALFCFLSVLCLTLLYCLRSRVRDLYHDEEEEEKGYVDIKLDTVSDSVTKL